MQTIDCERDTVLQEVTSLTRKYEMSFNLLRDVARRNRKYDVWNELGRGRSILSTQEQLNQYMFSYAPMIKEHWDRVFAEFSFPNEDLEVVDYGCGQGLASVSLLDKYYKNHKHQISKFTLVEPSKVAINRAKGVLQCYNSKFEITTLNKTLDELSVNNFEANNNKTKIHLFSNILDVEGFDVMNLFNKILDSKGKHYFLAASHHRYSYGGSKRIEDIYDILNDTKYANQFELIDSDIGYFNVRSNMPAIFFRIVLEVK